MNLRAICFLGAVLTGNSLLAQSITFGVPERLDAPVSSAVADFGSGISPDGKLLLFNFCASFTSDCDIRIAARADAESEFGAAMPLAGSVNTSANELYPTLSPDGLQLYFADALFPPFDNDRRRPGGQGGGDIWLATRTSTDQDFADVINLGSDINTPALEAYSHISPDGLTLLFSSDRVDGGHGGGDLYMATRDSLDGAFGDVTNLGTGVNSSANEGRATISDNGLVLFFDSDRGGGFGNFDIWMATRTDTAQSFGSAQNLGPGVNTPTLDSGPSLSADGDTLYFESFRSPNLGLGSDLWRVPVLGVLPQRGDTNGDGKVDIDDLNNVRNNFGAIGPDDGTLAGDSYPFDGMVNIDDLNGVRNNFGAGAAAVPEPAALALASLLALVAFIARPRRRP